MSFKITLPFFILSISLSLCSFAEEKIKADLLAVANNNHLLQYRENGEDKGPTIEILNAILKEAQLKANVSFMPWARAFSTVSNRQNTLVLSMIRTPEREDNFYWLIKTSQLARVFVSLKHKPQNYVENIEQAKEKLIAVVLGSAGYKELISHGFSEKKNLYIVSNDEKMVNLLVNGRVDLVYADPTNVKNNLNIIGKSEVVINYKKITPKNQRTSYIALNKDTDKKIVMKLQQAAQKFEKTSYYSRLLAQ